MTAPKLTGTVETGLKEGAYYMKLEGYRGPLTQKLGFPPYPGTLNLRVNANDLQNFLARAQPIHVNGFKAGERSFGSVTCHRVKINHSVNGALLLPKRTTHKSVAEVIARENLRKALKLKDGDPVTLELME